MKLFNVGKLKSYLIIWTILQIIVSAYISFEALNNYSSWETNPTKNIQLEIGYVYSIALVSMGLTIISTALLNLTLVILTLVLVYKLHRRWAEIALKPNQFQKGAQAIIYTLMLSELMKYFCVLFWQFNFEEWNHLRQLINLNAILAGCVFTAYVWINMRKATNETSKKAILFTSMALAISLGLLNFI